MSAQIPVPADYRLEILDLARWAPSGDNAQPWRFSLQGQDAVLIRILHDDRNVYEYGRGRPTLLSIGGLLENIRLTAARQGFSCTWQLENREQKEFVRITFTKSSPTIEPLLAQIQQRSVDRRRYKLKDLDNRTIDALLRVVPEQYSIIWFRSLRERLKVASLAKQATLIRLTIPEAFPVHQQIVDWDDDFSPRAIPASSLAIDKITLKIMRWSFANWRRADRLNMLGSPFFASLQMDLVPGIFSSSFFALRANRLNEQQNLRSAIVRGGEVLQRLWLKSSELGLAIQPCLAILAFAAYGKSREKFTTARASQLRSETLANDATEVLGPLDNVLLVGRIGFPISAVPSRSTRRPLAELME